MITIAIIIILGIVGIILINLRSSTQVLSLFGSAYNVSSTVEQKSVGSGLESAYIEWDDVQNATGYNVYIFNNSTGSYEQLDNELIRKYADGSTSYWRADAVGLSAGHYTFRIIPIINGAEDSSKQFDSASISVQAHDRTGFAWVNGETTGAYNMDGTLKENANVLYITEETKNTVSLEVVTSSSGKTETAQGLQNILDLYKKGYDDRPLDIRFIGKVTDPDTLDGGDIVISGNGSDKRIDCGITLEGIGEDTTLYGYGIRIKNATNVEIRNIAVMLTDSDEGDNIGLQQENDHVWVHNCDFFYGEAGSDSDQAKGDGALDCKKSTYVTFSYNHFWDSGKSNLLGLSEDTTEGLYITYHHNWYDHSDSRHPRIRFYSAHVYNNYYDGNSKYGVGACLGSSVLVEGNYFRNCNKPMMISMQGSDTSGTFSKEDGGMIKAYNNYMIGQKSYIPYSEDNKSFDAYEVSSIDEKVPESVKSLQGDNTYNNFDTSSIMYSYTADSPEVAREKVEAYAGRLNGGDFKWEFNDNEDDEDDGLNKELKSALENYESNLLSVGGNSIDDPGQTTPEPTPDPEPEEIAVEGVGINAQNITLEVGETTTVIATVLPENATNKNVTWSSSEKDIASVDNGLITGKSEGTATITVETQDGNYQASVEVNVINPTEEEVTITGIDIASMPTKTTYIKGEGLDLTGGIITVTYSDDTFTEVDMTSDEVEVTGYDSNLVGNQTLTISYEEQTTTFEITVRNEITGIAVATTPNKTSYTVGEELDLTGGVITVSYEDGTTADVDMLSAEVQVTGYNSTQIGNQTITVSYAGHTATFNVTVRNEVREIGIASAPSKISYIRGEELELAGGVITVTYVDGSTENVDMTSEEVEVTGYDRTELGTQTITVSYGGHTAQFEVEVRNEVTGIALKNTPSKTTYVRGEELDLTGGVITISYEDGTTTEIDMTSELVETTGYNSSSLGSQTITVSYAGYTTTFDIIVKNEVTGISIKDLPSKMTYVKGENIDLSDGVLVVTYEDGTNAEVPMTANEIEVIGFDSSSEGTQTVTISYAGYTATFGVTVKNEATGITIESTPSKKTYVIGEEIDLTGGVLVVSYEDGTVAEIPMTSDGIEITGYDSETAGTQTVTISYAGYTATFDVTVEENNLNDNNDVNDNNNNNTNDNNQSDNNSNNSNNSGNSSNINDTDKDNTVIQGILPQTGIGRVILIVIAVVVINMIIISIKYRKYKNIK